MISKSSRVITRLGDYLRARRVLIWQLSSLFLLAIVLRLIYFLFALDHLGMDRFWRIAPDTNTYWAVANELLGGDPLGQYSLFRVGPGYGFILAAIRTVFGPAPIFAILFSVLMGGLAPVAVYLLSFSIFRRPQLAMVAGLISAFSITSISLSCHILTDQTYFTMQCMALFLFVEGWRRTGTSWFVAAGLMTGAAALVRPSGQLWPLIFLVIPFLVPLPAAFMTKKRFFSRALLTGLLSLAIITSWSVRNYAETGVFTFGSNGMLTLRNCMVGQVMAANDGKEIKRLRNLYAEEDGDFGPEYAKAYGLARARVLKAFQDRPSEFAYYYLHNLWENVKAPNYFPRLELAILKGPIKSMIANASTTNGAITLLALACLVVLAVERRFSALVILGATFGSFTLLLGLSFWQGSRLHYPAEMAWAILLPYLAVWSWGRGCALVGQVISAPHWRETAAHVKQYLDDPDPRRL
jgi:4-amino-4-deoxy-L-arabinose transferase-like glycosyltransferase